MENLNSKKVNFLAGTIFVFIGILLFATLTLSKSLSPLILSFFCAYLLFPLVRRLEKYRVRRKIAVVVVFVLFLGIATSLIMRAIPWITTDLKIFFNSLPNQIDAAIHLLETQLQNFGIPVALDRYSIIHLTQKVSEKISLSFFGKITAGVLGTFSGLISTILIIFNLFLFPLFFYYVIADYEKIAAKVGSLIPRFWVDPLRSFHQRANRVLSGYLRGQVIVSTILTVLYGTGLSLIGLPFGFAIGIIAGVLSIIPYVGFFVGLGLALIMVLAQYSHVLAISVLVVFGIVQFLEGFVITPKIVGSKVGLGPLSTIIALIIGGNVLGFVGLLIAIPATGILRLVVEDGIDYYQETSFYKH
jgi:predicted PurR-regulated permease PerM